MREREKKTERARTGKRERERDYDEEEHGLSENGRDDRKIDLSLWQEHGATPIFLHTLFCSCAVLAFIVRKKERKTAAVNLKGENIHGLTMSSVV